MRGHFLAASLCVCASLLITRPIAAQENTLPPQPADEAGAIYGNGLDGTHPPQLLTKAQRQALAESHAAYLRNGQLQLERPENIPEPPPPPPKTPDWLTALGKFLSPIFNFIGKILPFVFWGAIILAVLGILYFLFGEALNARFGRDGKGKLDEGDDVLVDIRPDEATARNLLERADALAREGKFAEAVHLLLFHSIQDIQSRLENRVPNSLTAREIGGLDKLPKVARQALQPIIFIVEKSFFGGRTVDESGWQEARTSYENFAFGEGWS